MRLSLGVPRRELAPAGKLGVVYHAAGLTFGPTIDITEVGYCLQNELVGDTVADPPECACACELAP